MARIAGVELPKNKRMDIALTYTYGIGRPGALKILKAANVDPAKKSDDLSADEQVHIRQVIDTAKRVTGQGFTVREVPRREGDPPVLVAAVKLAGEKLDWRAEKSGLEEIISSAWTWHRRRFRR